MRKETGTKGICSWEDLTKVLLYVNNMAHIIWVNKGLIMGLHETKKSQVT